MGLRAAESTFGATVNAKGFKVVKCAGVIQGDGIDIYKLAEVLEAVLAAGFSAEVRRYTSHVDQCLKDSLFCNAIGSTTSC